MMPQGRGDDALLFYELLLWYESLAYEEPHCLTRHMPSKRLSLVQPDQSFYAPTSAPKGSIRAPGTLG